VRDWGLRDAIGARMRRSSSRRTRRRRLLTAGFVGGIVAGLVVWSMQMQRCRRDLFSPSAVRRLAALGYLGGQPGLETAQLLTEYVRWETKPVLRKRAERLLKQMQRYLV
jgi:hypothetical protein